MPAIQVTCRFTRRYCRVVWTPRPSAVHVEPPSKVPEEHNTGTVNARVRTRQWSAWPFTQRSTKPPYATYARHIRHPLSSILTPTCNVRYVHARQPQPAVRSAVITVCCRLTPPLKPKEPTRTGKKPRNPRVPNRRTERVQAQRGTRRHRQIAAFEQVSESSPSAR